MRRGKNESTRTSKDARVDNEKTESKSRLLCLTRSVILAYIYVKSIIPKESLRRNICYSCVVCTH